MQRLIFIVLYALADLFPLQRTGSNARDILWNWLRDMRRWVPTLLNILALAVVVVTVLVLWGTMRGTDQILRRTLSENPRMLCIDAYCGGKEVTLREVGRELLARIRTLHLVDGRVVEGAQNAAAVAIVEGAYGWVDTTFRFLKADGSAGPFSDGRTFHPDDPILGKLEYRPGREPPDVISNETGIIVGQEFLEAHGYADEPPARLHVHYKNMDAPVSVLAVASNLWGRDFLVPEGFWELYKNLEWNPYPRYTSFYLGPLSPGTAERLAAELIAPCDTMNVQARPVRRRGDSQWIEFCIPLESGWTREYFETAFLARLCEALPEEKPLLDSLEIDTEKPISLGAAREVTPTPVQYISASVYVRHMDMVEPTVAKLREYGLMCDSRILEDIQWARQLRRFGQGISLTVIGTVVLLAAANLYLSSTQKVQRKVPEIGILKAFGANALTVLLIEVLEASILCLLAVPLGIVIASWAGRSAEHFLIGTFQLEQGMRIFALSAPMVACTILGTFLICVAATVLASFFAVLKKPADALRYRV